MSDIARSDIAPLPIGLLIRNQRHELGLSQTGLAQKLGIPQGSISKLERGLDGERHASRTLAALEARITAISIRALSNPDAA